MDKKGSNELKHYNFFEKYLSNIQNSLKYNIINFEIKNYILIFRL